MLKVQCVPLIFGQSVTNKTRSFKVDSEVWILEGLLVSLYVVLLKVAVSKNLMTYCT